MKLNSNSIISYTNFHGLVDNHERWLNQSVRTDSSPTFGNVVITGSLVVSGNSTVLGTSEINLKDNIIILNDDELGAGVTLNESGIEIDRGTLTNYRFVYQESTNEFRVGLIGNTLAVACREDTPLDGGIMTWNTSLGRINSVTSIDKTISFTDSTDSVNQTIASIVVSGGISCAKDIGIYGKLKIGNGVDLSNSNGNLVLNSSTIHIPVQSLLNFGTSSSLFINTSGSLSIGGNIIIESKRVGLGHESAVYSDNTGMTFLSPNSNIYLGTPSVNLIVVPYNKSLVFGDSAQYISSNFDQDLNIAAGGNINMVPGQSIRIPVNTRVNLSDSGTEYIVSDTSGNVSLNASGNLAISRIALNNNYINLSTTGQIAMSKIVIQDTSASSIVIAGGTVTRDLFVGNNDIYTTEGTLNFNTFGLQFNGYNLSNTGGKLLIKSTSGNLMDFDNQSVNVTGALNVKEMVQYSTSPNALVINNSLGTVLSVDCLNNVVNVDAGLTLNGGFLLGTSGNANGHIISNSGAPVSPGDLANKSYVDSVAQGLSFKSSVTVATTDQVSIIQDLVAGTVIDGIIIADGNRVLVKNQINPVENGIYIVTVSGGTRSNDFVVGMNVSGSAVFVTNGTVNGSLGFVCITVVGSDVVGTNQIIFTEFTGLGQVTAGDGLVKTFNTIAVNPDNVTIENYNGQIRIKNGISGTGITGGSGAPLSTSTDQSHISKVGTIIAGNWNASNISVFYGGTGRSLFTSGSLLFGNGSGALQTSNKLFYNSSSGGLGIGTNNPTTQLHLDNISSASLYIRADNTGINASAVPSVVLGHGGTVRSGTFIERINGTFANGTLQDNMVIHSDTGIQHVVNGTVATNIDNSGKLTILNDSFAHGIFAFTNTSNSIGASSGNVVVYGKLGVNGTINSNGLRVFSGGANVQGDSVFSGNVSIGNLNCGVISSSDVSLNSINGTSSTGNLNIYSNSVLGMSLSNSGLAILNTNAGVGTSASFLVNQNICILSSSPSSIYTLGGVVSLGKSTAGNMYISSELSVNGIMRYGYNALNIKCDQGWNYIGNVTGQTISCFVDDLYATIENNAISCYGVFGASAQFYLYNDLSSNYHLFVNLTRINTLFIKSSTLSNITIINEGTLSVPNGMSSGYTGSWVLVSNTGISVEVGSLKTNGTFTSSDDFPQISHYSSLSGMVHSLADNIVTSNSSGNYYSGTLVNQSIVTSSQVKLPDSASADNAIYTGMVIQITSGDAIGHTRTITFYNGPQRVASLDVPWTVLPVIGDTFTIFNMNNASILYDSSDNTFVPALLHTNKTQTGSSTGGLSTIDKVIGLKSELISSTFGNILYVSSNTLTSDKLINNTGTVNSLVVNSLGVNYGTRGSILMMSSSGTTWAIDSSDSYISLRSNTTFGGLFVNTFGNIGIGTNFGSNLLNIKADSRIGIDSSTGNLTINSDTTSASLILYGSGAGVSANSVVLNSNLFKLQNSNGVSAMNVSSSGSVTLFNTLPAVNNTTASLVAYGGISIACTANCDNSGNFGALRVNGGAYINHDLRVNGDFFINGSISASGVNSSPNVSFGNVNGCTVDTYSNSKIFLVGSENTFSTMVHVTNNTVDTQCYFDIMVPSRTTLFSSLSDCIMLLNGFTQSMKCVFNIITQCVASSTTVRVYFQSSNVIETHYFSLIARYSNI